jgi:hypothetical protein
MTRYSASRKPLVHPRGGWLQASHEMTWSIGELAQRDDLIVKIAPDAGFDDSAYDENGDLIVWTEEMIDEARQLAVLAGQDPASIPDDLLGKALGEQHPGITFPNMGIVEINPDFLPDGVTPESMHPLRRSDRDRYPVIWGILAHEAAHANHSLWMLALEGRDLSEDEEKAVGAAVLLEESRIEYRQMSVRPQDAKWLAASGTEISLREVASGVRATKKLMAEHPELNLDIDKVKVSRAAALVLARIDAGSVEPTEDTQALEDMTRNVFGDEGYDRLRDIWLEVHQTADDDWETMMELGRRWYEETGDSGQDEQQYSVSVISGVGDGERDGDQLSKTLRATADSSRKEANGEAAAEIRRNRIRDRANKTRQESDNRKQAQSKASSVFAAEAGLSGHPVRGYRDPTNAEVGLARTARRLLQAAYTPERAITEVTRQMPPGRLSMAAVMQRDAQNAAGVTVTAEPFKYKDRRRVMTPPLKVGIIQDVSGSQGGPASAAVSGAWSLARATMMIDDAEVAMVSFGDAVHKIIGPKDRMTQVPVISANAGTQYFLDSLKAIEGALDLTRPGSARLVVILTDGYLSSRDLDGRDAALKRLTDYGVKILWLITSGSGEDEYVPVNIPGVHIFRKAANAYDIIPQVIVHEAVQALKK